MTAGCIPSTLLVTQHYWPEPIGSAPYLTDLAEWLAARDADIQVFTCRPHYPEGFVYAPYRHGQRGKETHGRVLIERVTPFQPWRRGVLGRVAREGLFLLQGLLAMTSRRIRRRALVISLCPSIFTVLLGIVTCRRNGQHIVLVHDIQSGLAAGLGMVGGHGIVALMCWLERVVLNRTDMILVLSENMRRRLREQGVRKPIEILPIWVDTDTICTTRTPRGTAVTVLYSGNLGVKQGLWQVLDMAERLQRRDSPVRLLLRGEGGEAAAIAAEVESRRLKNVRLAPLVPSERLSEGLARGAIHLVPQDVNAADFAVPSKAYTIMASGRPFVAATRPGSQLWKLCANSQAFLCVPPGDSDALADAVERLARDPLLRARLGRNGRRYVLRNHNKSLVLDRFISMVVAQQADGPWHLRPSRIS